MFLIPLRSRPSPQEQVRAYRQPPSQTTPGIGRLLQGSASLPAASAQGSLFPACTSPGTLVRAARLRLFLGHLPNRGRLASARATGPSPRIRNRAAAPLAIASASANRFRLPLFLAAVASEGAAAAQNRRGFSSKHANRFPNEIAALTESACPAESISPPAPVPHLHAVSC